MLILSFDVGIKNLAYCLLEYEPQKKTKLIKKWDIVNLSYYDTSDPEMNYLLGNYKTMKILNLSQVYLMTRVVNPKQQQLLLSMEILTTTILSTKTMI